MRDKTI